MSLAWLVAAAAMALLLAAACGGGEDGGSGSGGDDPRDVDLATLAARASEAFTALESFSFTIDFDGNTLPIQSLGIEMRSAEGDIIVPDRLRTVVEATAPRFGDLDVTMDMIAIGDEAWITSPFDRDEWLALDTGNPLRGLFDPTVGVVAIMQGAREPRITGEQEIDGIVAWRFEAVIDSGGLGAFAFEAVGGHAVDAVIWIGKEDGLVYRVHLAGQLHDAEPVDILRRLEFTNHNGVEPIEPPR